MEKPFVCMNDTVCMSDTMLVVGEVLDDTDRTKWNPSANMLIPAGKFIRAGSKVIKDEAKIKKELKLGMYLPAETPAHFDLESVFVGSKDFFGNPTSYANILRAYSIKTLEQVANNEMAYRPLLDKKKGTMRAQEVLAWMCGDKEEMDAWVAQCKDIVDQK